MGRRWGIFTGLCVAALAGCGSPVDSLQRFDAWVAFTDKGLASEADRTAAFRELERTFDVRALERRQLRRTRPGLFDDHDLPLSPAYVEQVAATGAEVRVRSRWLNGVTVLANREQLAGIERLPFVEEVTDVHSHVPKGLPPAGPSGAGPRRDGGTS